jgi:hypothetical protein
MPIAMTIVTLLAVADAEAPPSPTEATQTDATAPDAAPDEAPAAEAPPAPPAVAPAPAPEPEPAPEPKPEPEPEPEARSILRVAVYELDRSGIDERTTRVVTDALLAEVRKLEGISAISMDEIRAMLDLEAQKQVTGCDDDSCLAEIADALGVDALVIGSLSVVGDERVIGLRRIDQRAAKVVSSYNQRLVPTNGEEFLAAIGPAVEELFPEHELRRGKTRGVAEEIALAINPPPLQPWVFWTTAGTSGALAIGAGMAAVVNGAALLSWQATVRRSRNAPATLDDFAGAEAAGNASAVAAWTLLAASGAVAAGAGVAALFTDWEGYGDDAR